MKTRLLFVVLAVLLVAVSVTAGDHSLTAQVRNFEHARKIERAFIEAMIDPPGSFAITYWGRDTASQCPINPNHEFTITLRPDIDGTYINDGCTHEGPIPCFCDIYVRTPDTKQAWEDALEPYRHEHKAEIQVDPSPSARIEASGISYAAGRNFLYATTVAYEPG